MVNLRALSLAAGLLGLSTTFAFSAEEYDLPPQFKEEHISPELREDVLMLSREAQQAARQLIDAGEVDWLDQISDQVAIGSNPLVEDDIPHTAPEPAQEAIKHPLGDGFKTLIFVSWSMGEASLKSILSLYDGEDTTAIVFRGVPEGKTLAQGIKAIQSLSMTTKSTLPVLLDPVAFKTHAISSVPSVAIEDPDGSSIIKAAGTFSAERLQEALADGQNGNLGQLGPITDIAEPDLIEVAMQKMAELDFEAMKKKAIDRFWHGQAGHQLPTALEDARRLVDPTIIIHQDILDAEGNVVTPAGEINPLDLMPFDQKLIIIDPDQPWQVALAADEVRSTRKSITVTVMATRIDPDRGWDLFESTQDRINAALYLLPPDMASRFQIQKVPSIVTAESRQFVVTEISQPTAEERQDGL